jgi:hypothetical protein
MSAVVIRSDHMRYSFPARSMHVAAEHFGIKMHISIGRDVIEHLAEARYLDRDQSEAVVVRNKELLERAVLKAVRRLGGVRTSLSLALPDLLAALEPRTSAKAGPKTGTSHRGA